MRITRPDTPIRGTITLGGSAIYDVECKAADIVLGTPLLISTCNLRGDVLDLNQP